MRNKSVIAICLIFCFILSIDRTVTAQSKRAGSIANPIKLKSMPELNTQLSVKKLKSPRTLLMTSSGSLAPYYVAEFEGMMFNITTNGKDKIITFVSTNDKRFKTDEGIMVGDTLEKVLAASKGKVLKEHGWAFFVRLKSGWNAAFVQGREMTESELRTEAKVSFLFKR